MKWTTCPCVFGPGLASVAEDGTPILLAPFVAGDGSGRVAGYGLLAGRARVARYHSVTLAEAVALAELEFAPIEEPPNAHADPTRIHPDQSGPGPDPEPLRLAS